jgi:hypothetical protein
MAKRGIVANKKIVKLSVGMAYGMADVRERFTPGPVPVGV